MSSPFYSYAVAAYVGNVPIDYTVIGILPDHQGISQYIQAISHAISGNIVVASSA